MIKLSKRLSAIASLVPPGSVLADIGTDHALLPVYLVQQGIIPRAVAGELNAGPFEAARQQVTRRNLEDRISVRRGDGLSILEPGEAETVTIAGMGGGLIVDILSAGLEQLRGVRTLILQPNVAEDAVRRWLIDHDYVLTDELIIEEDGIAYVILYALHAQAAERTNAEVFKPRRLAGGFEAAEEDLVRFGPYLLERMEESFIRRWREEKDKLLRIKQRIEASAESPDSKQRLAAIEQEIQKITEVLKCSHMDRQSSR